MVHRFGAELEAAIGRAGLTRREFARKADCADSLPSKIIKGQRTPPLDQVEAWSGLLGLSGPERDRFLLYALLAHAPTALTQLVEDLIGQLAQRGRVPHLLLPFETQAGRVPRVAETGGHEPQPSRPRRDRR